MSFFSPFYSFCAYEILFMLKNDLKLAIRNLLRNKLFSTINIMGLAIGIATCLIILLFIQEELSYDRYNEKASQIVRVVFRGSVQGEKMNEAHVMPPVAQALENLMIMSSEMCSNESEIISLIIR